MAYLILFIFKEVNFINNIGEVLKSTRETSGVSLEEVSKDLNIPIISLTQIEEGNMGAFKDIFELKKYITEYSKYLGLNSEEVIDEFNEYLFEKTSKIPYTEIKQAAIETMKAEEHEERVASPYTKFVTIENNKHFIITIIIVIILVVLAIIWSIKQITIGNMTTNILEYFSK